MRNIYILVIALFFISGCNGEVESLEKPSNNNESNKNRGDLSDEEKKRIADEMMKMTEEDLEEVKNHKW